MTTGPSNKPRLQPSIDTERGAGRALGWLAEGGRQCRRHAAALLALSAALLVMVLAGRTLLPAAAGAALLPALSMLYLGVVAAVCHAPEEARAAAPRRALAHGRLWGLALLAGGTGAALHWLGGAQGVLAAQEFWRGGSALGLFGPHLAMIALTLLAYLAFCMAPAVVVTSSTAPWVAVLRSLQAVGAHPAPMLALLALSAMLLILSLIPLGLGLLAALPAVACALYAAQQTLLGAAAA